MGKWWKFKWEITCWFHRGWNCEKLNLWMYIKFGIIGQNQRCARVCQIRNTYKNFIFEVRVVWKRVILAIFCLILLIFNAKVPTYHVKDRQASWRNGLVLLLYYAVLIVMRHRNNNWKYVAIATIYKNPKCTLPLHSYFVTGCGARP